MRSMCIISLNRRQIYSGSKEERTEISGSLEIKLVTPCLFLTRIPKKSGKFGYGCPSKDRCILQTEGSWSPSGQPITRISNENNGSLKSREMGRSPGLIVNCISLSGVREAESLATNRDISNSYWLWQLQSLYHPEFQAYERKNKKEHFVQACGSAKDNKINRHNNSILQNTDVS